MVATASAADIVSIIDENRTLTYFGMQVYKQSPRPGLMAYWGIENKVRFHLPIWFFVWRLESMRQDVWKHGTYAVDLLLSESIGEATNRAEEIEGFNENRKALDREITQQALIQIEESEQTNNASTVVYDPNWHKGVIGIVASRLIETHYKPTVVFSRSGMY